MAFEETQRFSPILRGAVAAFVLMIALIAALQMPAQQRVAHFLLAGTPLLLIGRSIAWCGGARWRFGFAPSVG